MKRLSLQWRITLMTAALIGVTCVLMNCLIGYSGKRYMDAIGSGISAYSEIETGAPDAFDPQSKQPDDELTIIISGAQAAFGVTNWYITAAVTLAGGVLAYFVSGRALRPLRSCPSKNLSDVPAPDNWAHAGIDFCVRTGLMSGVGSGRFDPKGTTTRAQAVQVLYELSGAPKVSGKTPFTDLTHGWYQSAVLWAYQTGVTAGTSRTTFSPDDPVTREQLAALLMEYADRILKLRHTWAPANLSDFPDGGDVAGWARSAMADAVALGLISGSNDNGVNYLRPQGHAAREQTATILSAFCQNAKKR